MESRLCVSTEDASRIFVSCFIRSLCNKRHKLTKVRQGTLKCEVHKGPGAAFVRKWLNHSCGLGHFQTSRCCLLVKRLRRFKSSGESMAKMRYCSTEKIHRTWCKICCWCMKWNCWFKIRRNIANVKLKTAFLLRGFMLLTNSYSLELRQLVVRF